MRLEEVFRHIQKPKLQEPVVKPEKDTVPKNGGSSSKVGENNNYASYLKTDIQQKFFAKSLQSENKPSLYDAFTLVKNLPVPPEDDVEGIKTYNKQRAEIADKAIKDAVPPKLSDYKSLNGATASFEYRDAKSYFDKNMRELKEISSSAKNSPTVLPIDAPLPPYKALEKIKNLPPPEYTDPVSLKLYNEQVAAIADASIEGAKPPQLSDFKGLNGATASYEYREAKAYFDKNVSELKSISEKAKRPIELENAITPEQFKKVREDIVIKALGIDLPKNATPEELKNARDLVAKLPAELVDQIYSAGRDVSFEKQVKIAPGIVRNGSISTGLEDVQVRPGFERTQKLTVELEFSGGISVGKQRLSYLRGKAAAILEKTNSLPPAAQKLLKVIKSPIGFEYEKSYGARLTTEAILTPEQGKLIEEGKMQIPNAFDPDSMESGTSVFIKGQALEKTSINASYKLYNLESSVTDLKGLGIGVEKLDGNIMRVSTGPVDTIENEMFFGVGKFGIRAGLGNETSLEYSNMKTAEFDLNTKTGQAAYQHFLATGQIPSSGVPGVLRAGQIDKIEFDSESKVEFKIGGIGIDETLGHNVGESRSVTYDDGSKEESILIGYGKDSVQIDRTFDKDNKIVSGQSKYTFMQSDAHPALASYLKTAFIGVGQEKLDGKQDVQISLTESQLNEIRALAKKDYERYLKDMRISKEEAEKNPAIQSNTFTARLANTKNAEDAAILLVQNMPKASEKLLSLMLNVNDKEPLNGKIEIRKH